MKYSNRTLVAGVVTGLSVLIIVGVVTTLRIANTKHEARGFIEALRRLPLTGSSAQEATRLARRYGGQPEGNPDNCTPISCTWIVTFNNSPLSTIRLAPATAIQTTLQVERGQLARVAVA
jgi:hypothetical protein